MSNRIQRTKRLTISRISLSFALLSSDFSFSAWRMISRESAVRFSLVRSCDSSHLTFWVTGTLGILIIWSFREEGKVALLMWERGTEWNWEGDGWIGEEGDWGKYKENSVAVPIVRDSRDRCRVNAMLAFSVKDLALIISVLIAFLYEVEYASVRTIWNI